MSKLLDSSGKPMRTSRSGNRKIRTRRYQAPAVSTSDGGWFPVGGVERVPAALPQIRSRARQLAENTPYGAAAVRTLVGHIVGSGIRYSIGGDDGYRKAFREWARSTDCDFDGQQDLYGLQSTAVATMIAAGDCLLVLRQKRTPDGIIPQIQLIDPEQIADGATPKYKRNRVLSGVEVNESGKVIGYHVRPDPDRSQTQFVHADQAVLLYERLYPGQLRGIPRGAQALTKLHQSDSFLNAAIAKARSEACLTVFLKTPADESGDEGIFGDIDDDANDDITVPESLEPGAVIPLPEGYDAQFVAPSASGGLSDYLRKTIEAVSVAYGCTYAQIAGDVTGANYSSTKVALIEFHRSVDSLRNHVILPALARVEKAFRYAFEATEGVDVRVDVRMIPPARESIEPSREISAEMVELASGIRTIEESWLSRGKDPDEMRADLEKQAEWLASMAAKGMPIKFGSLDVTALLIAANKSDDDDSGDAPATA